MRADENHPLLAKTTIHGESSPPTHQAVVDEDSSQELTPQRASSSVSFFPLRLSIPEPPPIVVTPAKTNKKSYQQSSMNSSTAQDGGGDVVKPGSRHHRRVSSGRVLVKTQASTFWGDARVLAPGSVPHSMVLALVIGVVCGVAAFLYYRALDASLEFLWRTLPQRYASHWPENLQFLWVPMVGIAMAGLVGLTVRYVGEPGDLPYTIKCVHEKAYVAMDHVLPMVLASQFSILAGGSLGPEAPLVAICAALGGFISRTVFRQTSRNIIRKHTLMGMAGALAAFFGVPLGGSLFALEVNSRFGIEYFEHTLEAIFCGEVCLAVFRGLSGLPIAPIWFITSDKLPVSRPIDILYGAILGLLGGLTAWLFARFHKVVTGVFRRLSLLQSANAVPRALAASVAVVGLGLLVPQTMFWGEFEFQPIATMAPSSSLSHIWPTSGLLGFEMNSFWTALVVGVAKLVAVSFTVAGGYRGGYIFPCFAAAAALGRAVFFVMPFMPVQLCVLCMAAALNVALTRTAIASTLILSFLSGEQCSVPSILAASLMSLFVTAYMPFIHTQHSRADLDDAIFYEFELDALDDPLTSAQAFDPYNSDATDATVTTDDLFTPVGGIHKTMSANEAEDVSDAHTHPMAAVL